MELVEVYSAYSEVDAELMKSILDSEGIQSMIKGDACGHVIGGTLAAGFFGKVQILVRPEDADRAKEILSEVRIEPDFPDEEEIYEDE